MYGLTESQPHAVTMQRQMIREVESARPRFVVVVLVASSWLRHQTSHPEIFEWAVGYVRSNHERVGWVELPGPNSAVARSAWGRAAVEQEPGAGDRVLIYERTTP